MEAFNPLEVKVVRRSSLLCRARLVALATFLSVGGVGFVGGWFVIGLLCLWVFGSGWKGRLVGAMCSLLYPKDFY